MKRLNVGMPDVRAPHAKGNFKTPSGKCEFKSSMAEGGNMVLDVWRSGYTRNAGRWLCRSGAGLHPAA